MSLFRGRKARRLARTVVTEQRRQARADREAAERDRRWREQDARLRADRDRQVAERAARAEQDRELGLQYDAVVAADELDELLDHADHDAAAGMPVSGRMLRLMRAERVADYPEVPAPQWLPRGARPLRPAGRLHPALRRRERR